MQQVQLVNVRAQHGGRLFTRALCCRAGNLLAKGNFNTVNVNTNGAGNTYITGGRIGRVTAAAGGVGRVVIDPTNGEVL